MDSKFTTDWHSVKETYGTIFHISLFSLRVIELPDHAPDGGVFYRPKLLGASNGFVFLNMFSMIHSQVVTVTFL